MAKSRLDNTIEGSKIGLIYQFVYSFAYFIVRTVFIKTLGNTYLGINGLFSDILTLLSLAELGFGTSIMYFMYKPFAENDEKTTTILLRFYGKAYKIIGIVIAIIGVSLTPFLNFIISDIPDIPELKIIYLLYLLNTVLSYFWSYKRSMLIADQKIYISYIIQLVAISLQYALQIVALIVFRNFLLYLSIQVFCTFLNNFWTSKYVDKHYPYTKMYKDKKIPRETLCTIAVKIRAMFASKVSSAIVSSTDNILISKFVSTMVLGLYSNYLIFINLIRQIVGKIFEALTGSLGNLLAKEDGEKAYDIFNKMFFANFGIVSFCVAGIYVLIDPFIQLWIGQDYLLPSSVEVIICINLYLRLIRNTALTYCDTLGIFEKMQKKCIAEALLNIVISLFLLLPMKMGIFGVLLGTFFSNLLTNFWYEPWVLFKDVFKKSQRKYYLTFFLYFGYSIVVSVALRKFINLIKWDNLMGAFITKLVLFLALYVISFWAVFGRTKNYQYYKAVVLKRVQRGKTQ